MKVVDIEGTEIFPKFFPKSLKPRCIKVFDVRGQEMGAGGKEVKAAAKKRTFSQKSRKVMMMAAAKSVPFWLGKTKAAFFANLFAKFFAKFVREANEFPKFFAKSMLARGSAAFRLFFGQFDKSPVSIYNGRFSSYAVSAISDCTPPNGRPVARFFSPALP